MPMSPVGAANYCVPPRPGVAGSVEDFDGPQHKPLYDFDQAVARREPPRAGLWTNPAGVLRRRGPNASWWAMPIRWLHRAGRLKS